MVDALIFIFNLVYIYICILGVRVLLCAVYNMT